MASEPYLVRLTTRLLDGVGRLPAALKQRHADYLRAAQRPDGGFAGREGDSDLYYTGFALRSLALLEALEPGLCGRVGGFLRTKLTGHAAVADFFSLLYSAAIVQLGGGSDVFADAPPDWRDRVAGALEGLRAPDGGYRQRADNAAGSTYHTFLVALCWQMLDRPMPRPEDAAAFARSRRRDDGGFAEVKPMTRSGTNPTAAGVGILQMCGGLDDDTRAAVVGFLGELQAMDGGLLANSRVPLADLLSTFTGYWTLAELGAADAVHNERVRRFAESLQELAGGFKAGLWDERPDVEYTFYGLGTLALCELVGG